MVSRVINVVGFLAGWLACILGAGAGHPLVGPTVVTAFLAVHLIVTPDTVREIRFVVAVGLIGSVLDALQAAFGVLSFTHAGSTASVIPLWVSAFWIIFGTTFGASLRWFSGRYLIAGVFGGVAGPLMYSVGAAFGALSFRGDGITSLALLGLVWFLLVPGLLKLSELNAAPAHAGR